MSLLPGHWARVVDRELLISGFCHDVRGPLTAFSGHAEMEGADERSPLQLATTRLSELLADLPLATRPENRADLRDSFDVASTPVWVLEGFAPIEFALLALPHEPPAVELVGETAWLSLPGLPTRELRVEWNVQMVRDWLRTGGVGHAGARLRIASRLAGALTTSFVAAEGAAQGVLRIAFARAPA